MSRVQTEKLQPQAKKKRRRRKRRSPVLFIFIFAVLAAAGLAVSVTAYFKVQNFVVKGSSSYSDAEIVSASGIKTGQNLLKIDSDGISGIICKKLPYIKKVNIVLKPLSTVIITVTEDTPKAVVKSDKQYIVVDDDMKVLEISSKTVSGYPVISGLKIKSCTAGETLEASDESAGNCVSGIFEALSANDIDASVITSINVSDVYNIIICYDGRIKIYAGGTTYLNYKMKMAKYIIKNELTDTSKGKLDLSNAQPDTNNPMFFDAE